MWDFDQEGFVGNREFEAVMKRRWEGVGGMRFGMEKSLIWMSGFGCGIGMRINFIIQAILPSYPTIQD